MIKNYNKQYYLIFDIMSEYFLEYKEEFHRTVE